MPYPTECPTCGADLTQEGSVGQWATEYGHWSAHMRADGSYADFEEFSTISTDEAGDIFCHNCGLNDVGEPITPLRDEEEAQR